MNDPIDDYAIDLVRADDLEPGMDITYDGNPYVVDSVGPITETHVWVFLDVIDHPDNEHTPCSVLMTRNRLITPEWPERG